jgi:hypothetical protein
VKGFYVHPIISQPTLKERTHTWQFEIEDSQCDLDHGDWHLWVWWVSPNLWGWVGGRRWGWGNTPQTEGEPTQVVSQFDNFFCIKNPTISVRKGQIVSQWALMATCTKHPHCFWKWSRLLLIFTREGNRFCLSGALGRGNVSVPDSSMNVWSLDHHSTVDFHGTQKTSCQYPRPPTASGETVGRC